MSVRVTEVLDHMIEPELLAWMLRTPKAKREAKSEDSKLIGSAVDALIQRDLFPVSPVPPAIFLRENLEEAVDNCMTAWDKFKVARPDIIAGIKAIQVELERDGIMGHPDAIFEDANRWGIIDFKTSRTMYPRYWTQTAKYSDLVVRHPKDTKPRFIAILRLDKESGEPHYMEITDETQIAYEVKVFEAYLVAYQHNVNVREFIRQQLEMEIMK